ncbi:hypothetical protein R3X28_06050 [Maribacter sp. TH_r10]|uniref:CHAD domain-containing protein n=1 Tax=Maribacter luteus TaxID=2594478 RepID=A0A6I2MT90_9FLAO|nr:MULTISPECIES: hypothetical protein [Maribacter]MDV7138426.1 hypothetical protein [Maribacter sp. TH_r10]MRX66202.1 hypothetical protein [Maribacter luteus]|tara:strand:- start:2342 stop:2794 length:453 start_codon:yes stop_codon:yes gene_type:complete
MEKVSATSDILYSVDSLQTYILECEKLKSDIALKTKDIRFLQQLLDRYFDEIVQNENLDEIRESLMRFQDLCYNCSRLKKRIKDHQRQLVGILKGYEGFNSNALTKEQTWIEKRIASLTHDFISVEKEILVIADNVIQKDKENRNHLFIC